MSTYENRMIGIGEANIDRLGKILNALNAIYTASANFPSTLENLFQKTKIRFQMELWIWHHLLLWGYLPGFTLWLNML